MAVGSQKAGAARQAVPKAASEEAAVERAGARRGRRRSMPVEHRRRHILAAALDVFAKQGFAQARLDDVARQAGIAKGTVYLYFPTKEALFEALIRSAVDPVLARVEGAATQAELPFDAFLDKLFEAFRSEVLGTERKLVLQLLLREGAQFPEVAEFYHREVLSRGLALMRTVAARAVARGDLAGDALARFPHLIMAPLVLSIVWDGLFGLIDPLDVEGLLAAHKDVLAGLRRERP